MRLTASHRGRLAEPHEKHLDLSLESFAGRKEAGRHHPGVVDDEKVAGSQVIAEIRKRLMLERATVTVNDHEPRTAALRRRMLGDKLFGKLVVVVRDVHVYFRKRRSTTVRIRLIRRQVASGK